MDEIPAPHHGSSPVQRILDLQRTVGNQAVLRMLDRSQMDQAIKSPGQPLDEVTRLRMENRLGRDFSRVRIHADSRSAESAEALNARAYTVGSDIVYSAGRYDPSTLEGQKLLAHELTHVAQQPTSAQSDAATDLRVSAPSDAAEAEADSLSNRIASGEAVEPSVSSPALLARDRDQDTSKPVPKGPAAKPEETKPEPETTELTSKLDQIAQRYRDMIADARKKGYNVAADNLQSFLDGLGGTRKIDVSWLRGFDVVTNSEKVNRERFEKSLSKLAKTVNHADHKSFEDHWDRMLTAGVTTELYYASGTSTIRSTGKFDLEGLENIVRIGGSVKHHWFDPYDWHEGLSANIPGFGSVSDADALLLQKYRGAKPFMMEADWTQTLSANYTKHDLWFDSVDYFWSGP